MNKIRPNQDRAKFAVLLVYICLAVGIIVLISNFLQLSLLQKAQSGGNVTPEDVTMNDMRVSAVALIYMLTHIVSGIFFILWFRRAYYNLHLVAKRLTYSEGWAAGAWFVPFINLYRPYEIMKELYEETEIYLSKSKVSPRITLSLNYVGLWWSVYIISLFAERVITYAFKNENDIGGLINIGKIQLAIDLLIIPLAVVTVKVIKDYSKVEPLLEAENRNQNEMIFPESEDLLV